MSQFDLAKKLYDQLNGRGTVVSRSDLEHHLERSRSATTRLIAYCKDFLGMPIEYDRERGGYCLAKDGKDSYELPGLWFNASELHALMISHRLLTEVQPGILEPFIAPLQQRIEQILQHKHAGSREIFERIRILPMANREPRLEDFQQVTTALVNRKQLRIIYSGRSSSEKITERWVSPQRLLYYRDNWYLDAWCHKREKIRTFSLDRMRVMETDGTAKEISSEQVDDHVKHTFGIFAGQATHKAVIHFSNKVAEWIADEQWHPNQQSQQLENGKWELIIPYNNPTELVMDILKHGPDAEVISPPALRELVHEKLSQALRNYRKMEKV
jgi:predicted DNA-binding transcriptional regulator YafY